MFGSRLYRRRLGNTIDVHEASTVRHIIGFMKSIGVIYEDALEGGKVPNPNHGVTPSGEVLYSIIKMDQIASESEDKALIQQITNLYRRFYANVFIYWYVRDSKVHVARTVLKAIKKFDYLDKIEWFILNTYISETDNKQQEQMVEKYINEYRAGDLTLTTENINKRINSYGYWTQLLSYSGLIKKTGNKLSIGNQFSDLIEAILADDFLINLRIRDKYNLEV